MPVETPPPLPQPKNLRAAVMLNLFLPGAGQLYLGQRVRGFVLMALFLASFAGVLGIFLFDYAKYLGLVMGGDIFQGQRLEKIGQVFQIRWLVGLLGAGLAVYIGAFIGLSPKSSTSASQDPAQSRSDRPEQPHE